MSLLPENNIPAKKAKNIDSSLLATDSAFQKPFVKACPGESIVSGALNQQFIWDIELSNKCNARCYFCPRETIKNPDNMALDTMKQVINRIAEVSPPETLITACGHGESLLNPHALDFFRLGKERGFNMCVTTNGLLLNNYKSQDLVDAGLTNIVFSINETGEAYTKIYKLPFDKVISNIRRFRDETKGQVEIRVNHVMTDLTNHRVKDMRQFWKSEGVDLFDASRVTSRAGDIGGKLERYASSLYRGRAQEIISEQGFSQSCSVATFFPFIGWDGYYYLCCSDWSKVHQLGHVSDTGWPEALKKRMALIKEEKATICGKCEINIKNRLVDCLEFSEDKEVTGKMISDLIEDRKKEEALLNNFYDVTSLLKC